MDSAPAFTFDKATHTYFYNGRRIPGITEVLKYWKRIDTTYYTERGRQIGVAVHAWSVMIDRGRMNWDKVKPFPEVEGRLRAYEKFVDEWGIQADIRETPTAFPGGLYGTHVDIAGFAPKKKIESGIWELKCGGKAPWHKLQTGMQKPTLDSRPWRRWCVYLHEDATYTTEEHPDRNDELVGVGLASAMNYCVNNAA